MTVRGLFICHPADITVELRADVVEFMEDDPELLACVPVKETRHVEIYNVELRYTLTRDIGHAVQLVPVSNHRVAILESQWDEPSAQAAPAVSARGDTYRYVPYVKV